MAPDMIEGAPAGFPGGPALPSQRRLVPGLCVCDFGFFGPLCEYGKRHPSH